MRPIYSPAVPATMVYRVKPEEVTLTKRITRTALIFAITLLGAFLIHHFWFAHKAMAFGERLFDAFFAAAVFFALDSQRPEYDIEVTDEAISMRGGPFSRSRRVRRGHIHFLRESPGNIFHEPGLRLSEHSFIYRFWFGHVWIPVNTPEYERIKSKAVCWMEIG